MIGSWCKIHANLNWRDYIQMVMRPARKNKDTLQGDANLIYRTMSQLSRKITGRWWLLIGQKWLAKSCNPRGTAKKRCNGISHPSDEFWKLPITVLCKDIKCFECIKVCVLYVKSIIPRCYNSSPRWRSPKLFTRAGPCVHVFSGLRLQDSCPLIHTTSRQFFEDDLNICA